MPEALQVPPRTLIADGSWIAGFADNNAAATNTAKLKKRFMAELGPGPVSRLIGEQSTVADLLTFFNLQLCRIQPNSGGSGCPVAPDAAEIVQ